MRLLHVTHQYRPAIGGAEQYIIQLSEEMARRGHEVHVFTSRSREYETWRTTLPPYELLNGVHVTRFRSLPRRGHTWRLLAHGVARWAATRRRRYEPLVWYGNGPVMPGLYPALLRALPTFDLLHINNLHYAHSWPAAVAARLRRRPYVITPHIHAEQSVTWDFGYMHGVLRGAAAVVADTRGEMAFLRRERLAERVTVGGVGLELDAFPPRDRAAARARLGLPEGATIVLFLGRKTEYKGLRALLEAFRDLRPMHPELHLLAVGPETEHSAELWAAHGALPGLVVRGAVSDEERLDALAACDLLALPSTGEAFGIVYLEAWAYARPVVGLNIRAVQSLVTDGLNGFLVEPGDQEALAERLGRLVADTELRRRMGMAGRRTLERHYTTERIGDVIEGTYYRALRHHHARTRSRTE